MSTNVLSIRLPAEVKARLDALSASTGRPAAYYVREAVLGHIDELEWAYSIAAHAEAIRSGTEATRSFDEVASGLGFDPVDLRTESDLA